MTTNNKSTKKPKPALSLQERRAANAQKQFAYHLKRVQVHASLLKKWGKKIAYYEKALAESRAAQAKPVNTTGRRFSLQPGDV